MATTVNATATAAAVTTSATTLTNSSLTIAAGATCLLAWLMFDEASIQPSTVVVNWDSAGTPQAMTLLVEAEDPANTNTRVQLYGLVSPTIGNRSLTATWTSAVPAALDAISFAGTAINTVANVFRNAGTNSGTSGAPTLSLTSAVGNLSVAGVGAINAVTSFTATGSTSVFNTTDVNGFGFAGARAPGAAIVAWTGAPTSLEWAVAGVDVTASGSSSIVFRDFGSPTTRPWTDDWSLDWGPGSTGDTNLVFGAVVTRDYATPVEFRSTRQRDYAVPAGASLSVSRDNVVPIGSDSSTLIVSSGPIVAVEWLTTVNTIGSALPSEWRGGIVRDLVIPEFSMAQLAVDHVEPSEWGLSVRATGAVLIDFNMIRLATPLTNVEWRAPLSRDDAMALEIGDTVAWTVPVPAEWMTSAVISAALVPAEWTASRLRDSAIPAEFAGSPLGAAIAPLDWGQPAQMSTNFAVPMEFVSRIFQVHPEPLEFSTARTRDATAPAEWTGNTATTLDASAPAEWRGPAVADVDTSIEWRAAFTVDATTPSAWVSTIFTDPEVAPEMTLSVVSTSFIFPDADAGVRTEDLVSTASWGTTAQRDAVVPVANAGSATGATGDADVPLEFGGGLASTPWEIFLEPGAGRRIDALLTSAWLSLMLSEPETVAESTLSVVGESFIVPDTSFDIITEDHATPVEWRTIAVTESATFEVEHLAVTVADTAGMADWFGSTLSADVVALIEWTHDTAGMSVDADAPLDFLSMSVMTDVVISIERQRLRHSIGSQLEPDEWEREHD